MHDQTLSPTYIEPAGFFSLQSPLCRMTTLVLLFLLWFLAGTTLRAESFIDLPAEFGTVVYQTQGDSSTHLFIIANSHRSMITGANGEDTLQSQIETFQIGEWLIRSRQVSLLFPEGFFGHRSASSLISVPDDRIDEALLTQRLAETSSFVNAELLLHEHYGINLQQVEDRELYQSVRDALLAGQVVDGQQDLILDARLESLQKHRSDVILQSATALSQSNSRGSHASSCTILTIGLAHLGDILEFVKSAEFKAHDIRMTGVDLTSAPVPLDSYKPPVSITVIVPHCLLESLPLELHNRT